MGGTNLDNGGPKNISRTYKRKLLGAGTFIELELLRIVFWTYMCFPGSEIKKSVLSGTGDCDCRHHDGKVTSFHQLFETDNFCL